MNTRLHAWHLARRFMGGVEEAARHVGKPYNTFRQELSGAHGYKLGVDDVDAMTQAAVAAGVDDPLAVVNAMAANVGAIVLQLPQHFDADGDAFRCLAEASREFGVFMGEVADSLKDGKVTANELRDVEAECGKLMGKVRGCIANMRALHEAGKPSHLRQVADGA